MKYTAKQIAELIGAEIEGNPDVAVHTIAKIEHGEAGAISFLANPKYNHYLYTTQSSIIIINKDFQLEKPVSATLLRSDDAYVAFASLLEAYAAQRLNKKGVSSQAHISNSVVTGDNLYIGAFAFIGEDTKIGSNVKIYPQVYIGDNVVIGDNTTLFPGVKIYSDCSVGSNCTLHAGVVIGADGFGFAPQQDSQFKKIAQIGNVIIKDNVEIGANTTVDRATLGSTIIHEGVKLDNLIQIAHNVEIGKNTVIAAQTGVSGSTVVGENCMIAGQVGIVGHIIIDNEVKIGAQAGISSSLKKGDVVMGSPALKIADFKKAYIYFRRLPQLVKRLEIVEKLLKSTDKE